VTFDEIATPIAIDGGFAIEIPDGWQQGRGAFGGLVLAILTRAGAAALGDPGRPLRALGGELIGPVKVGRATITVEVLRAGTGVTTLDARLAQDGEVQAHATLAFGKPRPTFAATTLLEPPMMPPWRAVATAPIGPPVAPVFAQHVEYRLVGAPPFSGAPLTTPVEGWVRLREPGRARDDAFAVAMIDTYWPTMLAAGRVPRAAATLTFAYERVSDLDGLDPDAPFYYRARLLAGGDGYAIEARELWGEDGRLVALNQQTFVIMT